jgi:O-antigen/teichoic acid export membrane protein
MSKYSILDLQTPKNQLTHHTASMNREFFVNIIFLVLANALVKPAYLLIIEPAVQNRVGSEAYGMFFVLFNFALLLQIINDFGIQNFNSRELSQNRFLLDRYFSGIMSLKLVLAGVYFVIVTVLGWWKYGSTWLPMLWAVALNAVLFATVAYLRSCLAGLGMYRFNSFLSIFDKLLLLIYCSVLLWVAPFSQNFTIESFIHAQNLTAGLTVLVGFIAIYRKVSWFKIQFSRPIFAHLLRGALPYALAIFLMTIYTRTDAVMLEWLLPDDGKHQAGIYAAAYRLLDAVNILGLMFANLLMPMLARQLQEQIDIQPLMRFSVQLLMVAAVMVVAAVWFFRMDITAQLYDDATPFWGEVLGMLMFSFVAVSGTYIYSTLIGAAGKVATMNGIFIAAFFLNIALNLFLIPTQKALGAAISTGITQFFVFAGVIWLSKKLNLLRGGIRWSLSLWLFGLVVFGVFFCLKNWDFSTFWLVKMVIGCALSMFIAWAMGFLNHRNMRVFLK